MEEEKKFSELTDAAVRRSIEDIKSNPDKWILLGDIEFDGQRQEFISGI